MMGQGPANLAPAVAVLADLEFDASEPSGAIGGKADYDTADFVAGCRERRYTPHVAQNDTNRCSAIDGRTTRHPGYADSMTKRKRIEEPFGWMKTVGGLRKTRHCVRELVEWFFVLTAAAYNLVRIPKILAESIRAPDQFAERAARDQAR